MKQKTVDTLLIVWWICLFVLTTIPGDSMPNADIVGFDKIQHVLAYGGLATLFSLALLKRGIGRYSVFFISIFTLLIYGVFDEWHQQFIGRTCSLFDLLADMVGVTTFTLVTLFRKPVQSEVNDAD